MGGERGKRRGRRGAIKCNLSEGLMSRAFFLALSLDKHHELQKTLATVQLGCLRMLGELFLWTIEQNRSVSFQNNSDRSAAPKSRSGSALTFSPPHVCLSASNSAEAMLGGRGRRDQYCKVRVV